MASVTRYQPDHPLRTTSFAARAIGSLETESAATIHTATGLEPRRRRVRHFTSHFKVIAKATYVTENGKRITEPQYHRSAYQPGAEIDAEAERVKTVAQVIWTTEVVQAHRDRLAETSTDSRP